MYNASAMKHAPTVWTFRGVSKSNELRCGVLRGRLEIEAGCQRGLEGGDVQFGKTLQDRALSIAGFPERHQSDRRFGTAWMMVIDPRRRLASGDGQGGHFGGARGPLR